MAQQKRIKPGNLELNVEEQAIIAHYTTEVATLEPDGQRLSTESRPGKKTITIKNLSNNDSASLAQEIVDWAQNEEYELFITSYFYFRPFLGCIEADLYN